MNRDSLFPIGFWSIVIVIVALLWAVGDGRGPDDYRSEVQAARVLLADEAVALRQHEPEQVETIQSTMRSLDPNAVEQAERRRQRTDG